ncbi:MAG: hypothetical protein HKP48_03080 [Winogradskyella sp.]|uniref:hypothetical protein n=1 Tax=Winogradskyella sp. TaxID=1883156 RepID=UPI0017C20851|nr:hypothetical protein [Winogradskyella sp.]MBT8245484.1 hypothetical protein [Winogradskyella sp.]NNK22291.1 hypothetical protein [Winogradskyella sp.]
MQIGNVDITNELAAQVTANTVNRIMRETADRFAFQEVSTMAVEQYFRSELIRQFPLYVPGGRVQFNAMNFSGTPCIFRHL